MGPVLFAVLLPSVKVAYSYLSHSVQTETEEITLVTIRPVLVGKESFQWYSEAQGSSGLSTRSGKGVELTSELSERTETACSTNWPLPT